MIVGIDVGSTTHYARAFDWRNYEYSKKPFAFSNNEDGFMAFKSWIEDIAKKHGKGKIIPGMEPTGHYWFNLSNLRFQTQEEITRIKNRIARWFSIYFPKYKDVYGKVDSVSGMMVLKQAPLPVDIVKLGVGSHEALNAARVELTNLICDYEMYIERMDLLMETIEQRLTEILKR